MLAGLLQGFAHVCKYGKCRERIHAILLASAKSYLDSPAGKKYFYALTAMNRYNVESTPAQETKPVVIDVAPIRNQSRLNFIALVFDKIKPPGLFVIGIDRSKMNEEIDNYIFEAGDYYVRRAFRETLIGK